MSCSGEVGNWIRISILVGGLLTGEGVKGFFSSDLGFGVFGEMGICCFIVMLVA